METAILWHTGALIDELEITQVHELAEKALVHDGVAPLSEQTLLNLHSGSDDVVHLLTWQDQELAGYAQVDSRGPTPSAELVVRPERRRHGLGYHLLAGAMVQVGKSLEPFATDPLTAELHPPALDTPALDGPMLDGAAFDSPAFDSPEFDGADEPEPGGAHLVGTYPAAKPLRVWAHGDLAPARALAAKAGFVVVRELLLLHTPIVAGTATDVPLPPDLHVREFQPGADDAAWLALNARAFATHPEQGRWTPADLHARMSEDWFNPRDFLLLSRTEDSAQPTGTGTRTGQGTLVGFVWTKIEPATPAEGELFVVGVDPSTQGQGLGKLLTALALAHLAGRGVDTVLCYVDGTNTAAIRTYEQAGFTRKMVDVQYAEDDD